MARECERAASTVRAAQFGQPLVERSMLPRPDFGEVLASAGSGIGTVLPPPR